MRFLQGSVTVFATASAKLARPFSSALQPGDLYHFLALTPASVTPWATTPKLTTRQTALSL
jgi:hypothetical protein